MRKNTRIGYGIHACQNPAGLEILLPRGSNARDKPVLLVAAPAALVLPWIWSGLRHENGAQGLGF